MPSLEPPTIRRTFTVEQANATLPLVKAIIRDIMRLERKVRHTRFRLKFINRGGEEIRHMFLGEIRQLERELEQAESELDHHIDELLELGIEPEGLGIGLVDFPSQREGETIFLCWRYGEHSIQFWHTLTGGFPNRTPLSIARSSNSREPVLA